MDNFKIPPEKLWKIGAVLGEDYVRNCRERDGVPVEKTTQNDIMRWFKEANDLYFHVGVYLYSCSEGLPSAKKISAYDALMLFGIDCLEESVERCASDISKYRQDFEKWWRELV